jgi:Suppressor of fused protein (SUFU)
MVNEAAIVRHLRSLWEFNRFHELIPSFQFIQRLLPDLKVIRIDPLIPEGGVYAYVTCGVGDVPSTPFRYEFVILSPTQNDNQHLHTLSHVAVCHSVPTYALSVGEVVSLTRPWMDRSLCDHLLVSRPYLLKPEVEFLSLQEGIIRFAWLLPITSLEEAYLQQHGLEALEQLFERQQVQPLDPLRTSAVP